MGLVLPRIVVNAKVYREATGAAAVALCRAAAELENSSGFPVAVAVQAVDLRACAATGARVFAQHFDRADGAQATGATHWPSLVEAGASGSILNHSERRLPPGDLPWHVGEVRKAQRVSVLCVRTSDEARTLAALRPDLIAIEPPELIGGDVSVTSADPGIVRRSVDAVRTVDAKPPVLCGAGVKNGKDVARALELGAYGVLVASGVTRAPDPKKALADLVSGLRN